MAGNKGWAETPLRAIGFLSGLAVMCWGIWSCVGCGKNGDPQQPPAPQKSKFDLAPSPPPGWKGDLDREADPPQENPDFTGLRGVVSGKWANKTDPYHRLEFTAKSIEKRIGGYGRPPDVGRYEMKGDLLYITDQEGRVNVYGLEFVSDGEIALRPEKVKNGTDFNDLAGQWRRVSLPPGKQTPVLGTGPIADAKRQVQKIEQKLAKNESILKSALADRDELAARLRAVGVNSPADLKGNIRGQRLAENLVKLATEIEGLERHLAVIDTELLKAKSLVRRLEQEQAGLSDAEKQNLLQQLREAEERTNGAPLPTTPLDVDAAVEKALKAVPGPKK